MSSLVPTTGAALRSAEPILNSQYLTFYLGQETFAIGILQVKEIIEFDGVTPVPMMPACIRGVINLRGAVVPVVDLATRFGRPAAEITKKTCIVIAEIESLGEVLEVGMVVDAVNAVLDIPATDIEAPPAFGARMRPDFLQGMGKVAGKFVMLLDLRHILSDVEISAIAAGDAEPAWEVAPEPA